jgi:hypothetical protein
MVMRTGMLLVVVAWLLAGCSASESTTAPPVAPTPEAPTVYIPPPTNKTEDASSYVIYVGGEVTHPNRYAWTNGMTLKDALSEAGGLTEFAGRWLKIVHADGSIEKIRRHEDQLTDNPFLQRGDTIHCPSPGW